MNRRTKALYSAITAFSLQFILLIVNLILPRLIITNYGSDVNGLVNSITQFLGYIALLETGIGGVVSALLYKALVKEDNTDLSKIIVSTQSFFRKICFILIVYIAALCVFYPIFVNREFKWLYTVSLICIIGISNFIQYYFGLTNQLLIKANQRGYIINISKIATYILSTIVMVFCIKLGCSIQLVKLVGTLILALSPLSYYFYVKKNYEINYAIAKDDQILSQRWDGFAHQIAAFIHTNTDIALLTFFSTMSEVSVYSVYLLITSGLKSFLVIFSNSIGASFGNMYAKKEMKKLEKQFRIFDYFNIIVTIFAFAIAAVTIVPFVRVYTAGVSDANYIRPLFATLMVIGEAIYCLRCSYSCIIFVVGHFRETKRHAYLESVLNILISIILIKPLGVVGIAIGTLTGMSVRWLASIFYVNKNILPLNIKNLIKEYLVNIVAVGLFIVIVNNLNLTYQPGYLGWVKNAIILSIILGVVLLIFNFIFCNKEIKELFNEYLGRILNKLRWKRKN